MKKNKTLTDILQVSFSNIVKFGTGFIISFVLPYMLSVDNYGYYREYILYLNYIFILGLGFSDGAYIKYGGKDLQKIDRKTIHNDHNFASIMQVIMFIVMLSISLAINNPILIFLSIASLFVNLKNYYDSIYNATGNFSLTAKSNVFSSIIYIVTLLLAVFALKSKSFHFYIILNIASYIYSVLILRYNFRKTFGFANDLDLKSAANTIRIGIFILIANMSITLMGNAGAQIINIYFPIESFAQFAFQNNVLNVILLVVHAISSVFYNRIAQRSDNNTNMFIKSIALLSGIYASLSFFIFAFIIKTILPKFVQSIDFLALTFLSIPFIILIKILIQNLYKTSKSEYQYFRDSILGVALSFTLALLAYQLTGKIHYVAFSTPVSYILWYLYAIKVSFPELKSNKKELAVIVSYLFVFFVSAYLVKNLLLGMSIYILYLILLTYSYREEIKSLLNKIRN